MDSEKKKFGRYTLCRLLARGGMGEVYLATLEGVAGFEKRCVIKKIRPDLVSDNTFVERFLNEGKTLVALTQSNIVQIFDMGVFEGEYYLAMEYISGADLRQLLRRKTEEIPVCIAIAVVKEVLKGLSYAHRATDDNGNFLGIVHRDVSPSNILISDDGDVKLIDFGIAKANTIETMSGVVQGKFSYMSPEQARGEHLDARADLFSLGIVLYEMLSGIRPFDGKSDLQALERIKFKEHAPIRTYRTDLDEELSAIIDKALTKDIDKRYQTADEFYDALASYAQAHACIAGQREIIAFFKPFMVDEATGPQAYHSVNDALDAMLDAKCGLAFQTTATQTLPPSAQGRAMAGSSTPGIDITPGPLTPGRSTPTAESVTNSDSFRRISQAVERIREEEDEALSPVEGPLDEDTVKLRRKRRLYMKIRYGILGGLFAGIAIAIVILLYLNLQKPQPTPAPLPHETPVELTMPSADVAGNALWDKDNGLFAKAAATQQELPFFIRTTPDNAECKIAEGIYKDQENNSFKLIPGRDIEVLIQSPGYDTCVFKLDFDSDGERAYHNMEQSNCRSFSAKYSAGNHRFELDVALNPETPKVAETPQTDEPTDLPADAEVPVIDTATAKADAAPTAEPEDQTKEKHKTGGRIKPKEREKTAEKTDAKSQSYAVSTNFDATVTLQTAEGKQTLKASDPISAAPGTAFEISPIVSGRKIAIPYKGKLGSSRLDVRFCEAKIRINESFVSGDPAPYQLADIMLDGTVIARHADAVSLVLPCKSYEVSAHIHAETGELTAKQIVTLTTDKPLVIALTLH